MKKVKFNCTTSVLMIPDEKYHEYKASIEKLEEENYVAYVNKILAGSKFQFKNVKLGEITEVPNWYYDAHKNDIVNISNSFSKYVDKSGKRIPFKAEEAIRHGDMASHDALVKSVKKFELVSSKAM